MNLKFYVGITDKDWFQYLSAMRPDEVNFWQPSGETNFKVISTNELFLFKLHLPDNYIVGGGVFVRQSFLPVSLAWEAFGDKNGTQTIEELEKRLYKYKGTNRASDPDPKISCLILAQPFFWEREKWINMDKIWPKSIQKGKGYDAETAEGRELYGEILKRISMDVMKEDREVVFVGEKKERYGKEQIILPRLGQGAFRIVVTEAYNRRCAISGEKTLPVLEAAHIKPFSMGGENITSNGLLLRKDMHTLFDRGLITVTKEHIIEVSKRIKSEYGNGREYYAYNGKQLANIPERPTEQPLQELLEWHNRNMFVA